jgi:hypothetical protein
MKSREAGLNSSNAEFRAGLRDLARHRPDLAVRRLRAAAETCPASRPGALSSRLYWLATALLRLDRSELALKSLASAQKLRPRGHAREAYRSRVNAYGMPRRQSLELDDFYAFYSIHICDYLRKKEQPRFDSKEEKDAVVRLVADSWLSLSRSRRLLGLGAGQKLRLFKDWPVAFPSFGFAKPDCGSQIDADFRSQTRLQGDERCRCGSGLPFRQCCGRTSSPRELGCA